MKKFIIIGAAILASMTYMTANANTVSSNISGNFISAFGTFGSFLGASFNGSFTFGTTAVEAQAYTLMPGVAPADIYTSVYLYSGGGFGGDATTNAGSNLYPLSTNDITAKLYDNLVFPASDPTASFIVSALNLNPNSTYDVLSWGFLRMAEGYVYYQVVFVLIFKLAVPRTLKLGLI